MQDAGESLSSSAATMPVLILLIAADAMQSRESRVS